MANQAFHAVPQNRSSGLELPRAGWLVFAALLSFGLSFVVPTTEASGLLIAMGVALVMTVGFQTLSSHQSKQREERLFASVDRVAGNDSVAAFATNDEGAIVYQNDAAVEKFGKKNGATLVAALGALFASPSAVLYRLKVKAEQTGSAREDVALRRGHLRLTAVKVTDDLVLWRFEEMTERHSAARGGDGISIPMLNVSNTGTVLYINEALRRLIGGREAALDRIINDLPIRSGSVHEIAALAGPVRATVVEVESSGGKREIYLLPVLAEPDSPVVENDWQIVDALPVPLLRLRPDGQVLAANRASRELFDLTLEQDPVYLGSMVEGLGRPIADWLADAAAGRGPNRSEFVRSTKLERDVYLQISLGRVEDKNGVTLVAVLNDETELKTLEAQFVQSQKMQAIGQLAGGVAHDFNNLLTAISGHCDLLLLRHDEGDPDFADLEQINQNANRAASLVGQLLAFSRKQNLQPQVLDLRDCLSELTHLLNRLVGERIDLEVVHGDDLEQVRADKRQFEQVMMNLVVNARDAMPDGGKITVQTKVQTLDFVLERDRAKVPPGRYVVVSVRDEGVGIPRDKLPKIFEPFFTTKRAGEGTGLGLSTAYGIVKQTGGYIFADSEVGEGTCFMVYLPVHESNQVATPMVAQVAPETKARLEQKSGVVLLVEDEAPVRAFASRALRLKGFTVVEAANAEEALEALEDSALDVDVFVTDVVMPGMDGPSWVSEALVKRPDTRVVFVSGYAEDHLTDSQAKIPNSVFLPKPFSLNDLTSTVHEQIH